MSLLCTPPMTGLLQVLWVNIANMRLFAGSLQERVGTVEKQKNDLMMQQAMMQQQGESSHLMQGPMLGTYGPGELISAA